MGRWPTCRDGPSTVVRPSRPPAAGSASGTPVGRAALGAGWGTPGCRRCPCLATRLLSVPGNRGATGRGRVSEHLAWRAECTVHVYHQAVWQTGRARSKSDEWSESSRHGCVETPRDCGRVPGVSRETSARRGLCPARPGALVLLVSSNSPGEACTTQPRSEGGSTGLDQTRLGRRPPRPAAGGASVTLGICRAARQAAAPSGRRAAWVARPPAAPGRPANARRPQPQIRPRGSGCRDPASRGNASAGASV